MPWVEISQAAFMMGISERTIRNWVKSGKISAKTENGRRMVEMPEDELNASAADAEPFPEDEDFRENEEPKTDILGAQKRLEVALLECGRVKGTLASQERIMETLSSNIGGLTAKLQKSQNRTWKWIIFSLIALFLGIVVVLYRNSDHDANIVKLKDTQLETIENKNRLYNDLKDERVKQEYEFLKELTKREKELEIEQDRALQEQKESFEGDVEKAEAKITAQFNDIIDKKDELIKDLRGELNQEIRKVAEIEAAEKQLKKDMAGLEAILNEKNMEIEDLEAIRSKYLELQEAFIKKGILGEK